MSTNQKIYIATYEADNDNNFAPKFMFNTIDTDADQCLTETLCTLVQTGKIDQATADEIDYYNMDEYDISIYEFEFQTIAKLYNAIFNYQAKKAQN